MTSGENAITAAIAAGSASVATRASKVLSDAKKIDADLHNYLEGSLMNFLPVVRSMGHLNNGADNARILTMTHNKKRDDTVLRLTFSGGARIIGHGRTCRWFFRVDNADCRDNSANPRGHIDGRFHGTNSVDLHRVLHLDGVCFRKSNGPINKGNHVIALHVEGDGDCYTGWSSNNRLTVHEIAKPTNVY